MSARRKAPVLMPESPDARFGWIPRRLRELGEATGRTEECEALAAGVEMLRANLERERAWTDRLAGDICELRLREADLAMLVERGLRAQADRGVE